MQASALPVSAAELTAKDLKHSAVDNILYTAHRTLTGVEPMRALVGAGANTRDNPQRITDYEPAASDVGGLFDDRRRAVKAHGLTAGAAAASGSQPTRAAMRAKARA